MKGMANSEAGLQAYLGLAGALQKGQLSGKEREVIALTLGEANECHYCVAAHTKVGMGMGLTEEQTLAARKGGGMGDDKLDALAKFVLRIKETNGYVSEKDLKEFMDAGYNEAQVVEVIGCYALNMFTNIFNHVNDTEIDFPAPPPLD